MVAACGGGGGGASAPAAAAYAVDAATNALWENLVNFCSGKLNPFLINYYYLIQFILTFYFKKPYKQIEIHMI